MTLIEILNELFNLLVIYKLHAIVIVCGCSLNLFLLPAFLVLSATRLSGEITREEEERWKK